MFGAPRESEVYNSLYSSYGYIEGGSAKMNVEPVCKTEDQQRRVSHPRISSAWKTSTGATDGVLHSGVLLLDLVLVFPLERKG